MSNNKRYPNISIRSKNEIAKRISSSSFSKNEALDLINDVIKNFDSYWYDSKRSEPEKNKYVRSAAKSPKLKKLLELINAKILTPYDYLIPEFIYGGISRRNNIQAAYHLLGNQRNRTLLKLDVQSFFEQITKERVFHFFNNKSQCTVEASNLLAKFCCVPRGPKNSGSTDIILARGFATSSRLAVWCNLDTFEHLNWKIKKKLKGHDAQVAIYVDDIGISASKVSIEQMETAKELAINILEKSDYNQSLPVHRDARKNKIIQFNKGAEHLGIKLGRTKLTLGNKSRSKIDKIKEAIKEAETENEKNTLREKYKAHHRYRQQVKNIAVIKDIRKKYD